MDPILFQIGRFKLTYYGLGYAISFFIGITIITKNALKKGIPKEVIEEYAFWGMLSGLLGGRLYYVLFNFSYYFHNPSDILAVWKGGMAIHGGIIGGFIGTYFFAKKYKVNMFTLGDLVAPLLLLGQAIGRFGNLANGEIHGVPTFTPLSVIFKLKPSFYQWYNQYNLLSASAKAQYKDLVPWGLVFPNSSPAGQEFPGLKLHPAMLYESFLNFVGFLLLYFYFRKKNYAPGSVWWIYIIIYSINRTFVSFFRAEDLSFFGYRAPHVISLILVIIAVTMLYITNRKKEVK